MIFSLGVLVSFSFAFLSQTITLKNKTGYNFSLIKYTSTVILSCTIYGLLGILLFLLINENFPNLMPTEINSFSNLGKAILIFASIGYFSKGILDVPLTPLPSKMNVLDKGIDSVRLNLFFEYLLSFFDVQSVIAEKRLSYSSKTERKLTEAEITVDFLKQKVINFLEQHPDYGQQELGKNLLNSQKESDKKKIKIEGVYLYNEIGEALKEQNTYYEVITYLLNKVGHRKLKKIIKITLK